MKGRHIGLSHARPELARTIDPDQQHCRKLRYGRIDRCRLDIRCVRGTNDASEPRKRATLVSAICVFVSQLKRAKLGPELVPAHRFSVSHEKRTIYQESWRKRWDSNPRTALTVAGFQDQCLKPLGHTSLPATLGRANAIAGEPLINQSGNVFCHAVFHDCDEAYG